MTNEKLKTDESRSNYFHSQAEQSDTSLYRSLDGLEGVPQGDGEPGEAQRLRIVVVGHVDHGKSTLIGRVFYDTDSMPTGKVEQIRKACELEGMPFEYAFLLDALLEEQEQNITIDTTRIPFKTKKRAYEIIDAPGHKEFLKNMITGAASADAAVLVIAANEGVREQSRRHGYLLRLLGVRQIVVAVNKMDLVNYDRATFDAVAAEYKAFLSEIGVTAERFVPISAREGDNIAVPGTANMFWYTGLTILETLDDFAAAKPVENAPLRFVTQDIYRFDARRLIAGRVEAGTLAVGDSLTFYPGNRSAKVATLEQWNGSGRGVVSAGESVAFTLDEQIFAERGHVATHTTGEAAPLTSNRLRANLFWLGAKTLPMNEPIKLRLGTQEVGARIVAIDSVIDASTLETVNKDSIAQNDVAEIVIETDKAVAFDRHADNAVTGRFVLIQDRRVAGGGILLGNAAAVTPAAEHNIVWSDGKVSSQERAVKNGHGGAVIWLTGLSGSGKSTLAATVNRALFERKMQSTVLDGDNLRHGLNADLGFAEPDRNENIRRAAHVAALMAQTGMVTLCAFISPYREDRAAARKVAGDAGVPFVEVFVDAPLSVCEDRDVKGLYQKARAGAISNFTGIDAPYEPPPSPELHLSTEKLTQEAAASVLFDAVIAAARP